MTVKEPLIFLGGVAVGAVGAWMIVKDKYKTQAEEEINSVKETFARISQEAIDKAAAAKNKPDLSIYTQALAKAEENKQIPEDSPWRSSVQVEKPDDEDSATGYLYEITPSEFANYTNDRTRITVTRFMDDIFVDEMYGQIDPKEFLDKDLILLDDKDPVNPIDYIRRMPKDEICIRNFELNMDIDVYTEDRTYSDFMSVE